MNTKIAILLSMMLASGTALAGGEYGSTELADQAAMDQGITGSPAHQDPVDQGVTGAQQQEESFSQADANADGLISEEEAQAHQQLADNFDQADANADGYVNRSEYNTLLGEQTLQE